MGWEEIELRRVRRRERKKVREREGCHGVTYRELLLIK